MIGNPNSLHIGHIMLSEAYYEDGKAGAYENLEALSEPLELQFSPTGDLLTELD